MPTPDGPPSNRRIRKFGSATVGIALALMLGACSQSTVSTTTTTVPTTTAPVTSTATAISTAPPETTTASTVPSPAIIPDELAAFDVATIRLDGVELLVAIADTSELRRQGLMNVEDLGSLDGMLFVFDEDSTAGFWMKNTLIPLDIAFFAADGSYVDGFAMEPCTTADCPTYRPDGAYRYALEMPLGAMPDSVDTLER